jgi:hypothetical protein
LETLIVAPVTVFVRVTVNPGWRVVLVSMVSLPDHPVAYIPIARGEAVTLVIPIEPDDAEFVVVAVEVEP